MWFDAHFVILQLHSSAALQVALYLASNRNFILSNSYTMANRGLLRQPAKCIFLNVDQTTAVWRTKVKMCCKVTRYKK